jgi:hypothetical protein
LLDTLLSSNLASSPSSDQNEILKSPPLLKYQSSDHITQDNEAKPVKSSNRNLKPLILNMNNQLSPSDEY